MVRVGLGHFLHDRIRCFIPHGDKSRLPTGERDSSDEGRSLGRARSCRPRSLARSKGQNHAASVEQIEPTHTLGYAALNQASTEEARSW